eukprot:1925098-Rhodomonas_salina.1
MNVADHLALSSRSVAMMPACPRCAALYSALCPRRSNTQSAPLRAHGARLVAGIANAGRVADLSNKKRTTSPCPAPAERCSGVSPPPSCELRFACQEPYMRQEMRGVDSPAHPAGPRAPPAPSPSPGVQLQLLRAELMASAVPRASASSRSFFASPTSPRLTTSSNGTDAGESGPSCNCRWNPEATDGSWFRGRSGMLRLCHIVEKTRDAKGSLRLRCRVRVDSWDSLCLLLRAPSPNAQAISQQKRRP